MEASSRVQLLKNSAAFALFLFPLVSLLGCRGLQCRHDGLDKGQCDPPCRAHSTYLIEHILQLVLRQCRTFYVLDRAKILRHFLAILTSHRLHPLFCQLLFDLSILPQIDLGANDKARYTGAVVVHLWEPFLPHVLERRRRRD